MRSLVADEIVRRLNQRAMSMREISDALGKNHQYIKNVVHRLVLAGHVTRDGLAYYCLPGQHRRYFGLPDAVEVPKPKPAKTPEHCPIHQALFKNAQKLS